MRVIRVLRTVVLWLGLLALAFVGVLFIGFGYLFGL